MRRAARRDPGEPAIIAALRGVGAVVRQLDGTGLPDLLVGWQGVWRLLEVKAPLGARGGSSRKGQKLRPKQELFREAAKVAANCEVHVVRSVEEALAVLDVSLVSHSVNDRC